MTTAGTAERVLIVAPVGRDAPVIAELLRENGHEAAICHGADEAAAEAAHGAGALLLTEESLEREQVPILLRHLGMQPAWSEVPVIILTRGGESRSLQVLDLAAGAAGSITLLERPLGRATLLRTVEVALRSRRRQYQVRDLLAAQSAREATLREADRRKDTFLAILSHELRNPLAPIRNAAELLHSETLTPQQLRWTQNVIRRQTANMTGLLDDLLDLARVTHGKVRLRTRACSLKSVLDAAVETARPMLDEKRHRLTIEIAEPVPSFQADPLRLAQAISNLLTNAAKYTDACGTIDLSARLEEGTLVISVKDSGIGIHPERLGQLFQMFSQVSPAHRAEGGLGIGLALVKGFVELHGGTVAAHSAGPGRGTEFTIRLPLVPMLTDALPSAETAAPANGSAKVRMLIADDNVDAADSLALLLSLDGYEVRTAYNGPEAVTVAQMFHPDVALLDIGMPDMDGYATGSAIRQQPGGTDVCLIALTGRGQDDDKHRSRQAGFAMHLTKPVDPSRLRTLLLQLQRDRGHPC
jgi:signal transduction histidine kinase/ActR/RegA family two-component response regulator